MKHVSLSTYVAMRYGYAKKPRNTDFHDISLYYFDIISNYYFDIVSIYRIINSVLFLDTCPDPLPPQSGYAHGYCAYVIRTKHLMLLMTREKLTLLYVNTKGPDQPALPHSLISAFVIRYLDSNLINVLHTKLVYVAEKAVLSLARSETPKSCFLALRPIWFV